MCSLDCFDLINLTFGLHFKAGIFKCTDGVRLLLLMLSTKAFANEKSLDNVNNESLTPPRNANTES
ncbi:hypothetical protein SAMN02746065_12420 [Desulfocicer vacuolatum DSM 3385]|uniref:Uncharacterized protein n=3 Tax=Desulfocicer vacuolatum DSM 3385 TaxID=1121400 RepID=A0A1W2E470_9BACT|nr:hypothetical protein SAMN02746065_12420 [Desulfocicer vacuolatum DSM 3385]